MILRFLTALFFLAIAPVVTYANDSMAGAIGSGLVLVKQEDVAAAPDFPEDGMEFGGYVYGTTPIFSSRSDKSKPLFVAYERCDLGITAFDENEKGSPWYQIDSYSCPDDNYETHSILGYAKLDNVGGEDLHVIFSKYGIADKHFVVRKCFEKRCPIIFDTKKDIPKIKNKNCSVFVYLGEDLKKHYDGWQPIVGKPDCFVRNSYKGFVSITGFMKYYD